MTNVLLDIQINEIIERARKFGCESVVIDSVTYNLGKSVPNKTNVEDAKAEDLVKPMSPFEDLSDDEILYWSTPYGMELEFQKKQRAEQIKDGELTNG